jgi:SAM-dependent methyltransferase
MTAILSPPERQKRDDTDDRAFYESPRFVTHADDGFLDRLTAVYAAHTSPGDRVFDAMSSWVSFLPEQEYEFVLGHGLNERELAENAQLDEYFVQNLNADQELPIEDGQFDALCCALSVQYLQYPGRTFEEFERVLVPGGTVIVSFTNRMFPTKAVAAWRQRSMDERAELVERYLEAGGFTALSRRTDQPDTDPFYAVVGQAATE